MKVPTFLKRTTFAWWTKAALAAGAVFYLLFSMAPTQLLGLTVITLAESLTAFALAATISLPIARLSSSARRWLDPTISRGIEFAGALPTVLLVPALAARGWPVAPLVAITVGMLGALRGARIVSRQLRPSAKVQSLPPQQRRWYTAPQPLPVTWRAAVSSVPAHVVGLEAALTWLDVVERPWTGGWGQELGRRAAQGTLVGLLPCVVATMLLAKLVDLLLDQFELGVRQAELPANHATRG